MTTRIRLLDDAAWVSVDDARTVGASEVWPVRDCFCSCSLAWLAVESFADVGVVGRRVDVRVNSHCISCGEAGQTGWLAVGVVSDDGFRRIEGVRGFRQV